MLVLVLACDDGKVGDPIARDTAVSDADTAIDTDPAPDTDTAPDTAPDTDTVEPWEPLIPRCDLVAPRELDDVDIPVLWHLYGPDLIHMASFAYQLGEFERSYGCPTSSVDAAGALTFEGSCTFEDFRWEGMWRTADVSTADGELHRDDFVGVAFDDPSNTEWSVTADGYAWYLDQPDGVFLIERDFVMTIGGYSSELDGAWDLRSSESWVDGTEHWITDLYANVAPEDGPAGDYCLYQETRRADGCAREPWGGWVVVAAQTMIVAYDPDVACDGCAEVTIDGEPAGQVCE